MDIKHKLVLFASIIIIALSGSASASAAWPIPAASGRQVSPAPSPAPRTTTDGEVANQDHGDATTSVWTLGGAVLPSGGAKGGVATVYTMTGERRWSVDSKNELRLGVLGSLEETYYQSSLSFFIVGRRILWFGSGIYGLGYGLGLGFGSFSPKRGYNADDGASLELLMSVAPVIVRLGDAKNVELSLQTGIIRLFSFSEWDPGVTLGIGFATCWPGCGKN